jgi:maleate cis-trans isomerase
MSVPLVETASQPDRQRGTITSSLDIGGPSVEIVFPWFRLGVIRAHQTHVSAYQSYRIAPEGLVLYLTHQNLDEYSIEAVEANMDTMWECVDSLTEAGVHRIVLGGVPVAAAMGRDRVLGLHAKIEERSGIAVGSSFEDHIAALTHLGAKKVALANRWPEQLNHAVKAYLEGSGFEVGPFQYAGGTLKENEKKTPEGDHETALELGRAALTAAGDADALLLPGGNGFFLYASLILEEEFDVPVLTNHTSTIWAALDQVAGPLPVKPDPRWGRLLASL